MPSSLWFFKDNNDNIAYTGIMKLASCKIKGFTMNKVYANPGRGISE